MRNKTFTRLLCLALSVLLLVSGAVTVVGAQEIKHDNLTDKTIADYKETLDLISYAEYQNLYYANAQRATEEILVKLTENWKYVWSNIVITTTDGVWEMIVLDDTYFANLDEAKKAGVATEKLYRMDDGRYREIVESYDSVEAAKAVKDDKGAAKYDDNNMAYVTEEYDGRKAVYTPGRGAITWTIDLTANGVTAATLFSLGLDYYPVVARSTAIEREFYINGKPPSPRLTSSPSPRYGVCMRREAAPRQADPSMT